jgi:hypothetical protein
MRWILMHPTRASETLRSRGFRATDALMAWTAAATSAHLGAWANVESATPHDAGIAAGHGNRLCIRLGIAVGALLGRCAERAASGSAMAKRHRMTRAPIFAHSDNSWLPNALVQLQAQYHDCGEAASEKCLSAATFVRRRASIRSLIYVNFTDDFSRNQKTWDVQCRQLPVQL